MADDTQLVQSHCDLGTPMPPRRMVISDTIRVNRSAGAAVRGHGGWTRSPENPNWQKVERCTLIEWKGPRNKPMFHVNGVLGGLFSDLTLVGEADAGIQFAHDWGSLQFHIVRCTFQGQRDGIRWGTFETENTCANCVYDSCFWSYHENSAVQLVNKQSLEHTFIGPQFNNARVAVDVVNGGSVHMFGGGSHTLESLLRLDKVGSNTRGFSVNGFRFDAGPMRTAWLEIVEPERRRTMGPVLFNGVTQIKKQLDSDIPLITVPPAGLVVLNGCSFNETFASYADGSLLHCHSDRRSSHGEAVFQYCDGLAPHKLEEMVTVDIGARAEFIRCGVGSGRVSQVIEPTAD